MCKQTHGHQSGLRYRVEFQGVERRKRDHTFWGGPSEVGKSFIEEVT